MTSMQSRFAESRQFLHAFGVLCCFALAGCSPSAPVATKHAVAIAAASDLKFALVEAIAGFKKENADIDVQVTYGSSGNFFAQLSSQAPFDLYLSADIEYPRKLIEAGHADRASEFEYAVGQIVVWAPKDSPLDVEGQGIQCLADESVRKISIANPEHAPYGRAASAAMKKLGLHDKVKDKLVLGENISQTAQFIESGGADVGIIALSLALAPKMVDKGKYSLIPQSAYPTMHQGGVILNWAQDRPSADKFCEYLKGPSGREILKRYGFVLPWE
jgi:molybdate transport system substrate-binding protein